MTKYAKQNLKVVRDLEKEYGMSWKQLWETKDWTDLINYARMQGLVCSVCGGRITANNLKFYNWDVSKVKCYDCQQREHLSNELFTKITNFNKSYQL